MIVRFSSISMKVFTLNDCCNNRSITWSIHDKFILKENLSFGHRFIVRFATVINFFFLFFFGECVHCRCINRFSLLYIHCPSRLKNFFFGFYFNFVLKFNSMFCFLFSVCLLPILVYLR